jgi:hypothetical protein
MLTVVKKQLLNQVDVRQDHAAAAVSLELETVEGLTVACQLEVPLCLFNSSTHPSSTPADRSSRYDSHRLPTTLPHEKHRTGMIWRSG